MTAYLIIYTLTAISIVGLALSLARLLWSLNRARLIRQRNARTAAMLEYRHVWRERVIDNAQ